MSNILKTPDNASVTELLRVQKRYQSPSSSMEAFILHGANSALKDREQEHLILRGLTPDPEPAVSRDEESLVDNSSAAEEFHSVLEG